jgi:hypothetical protein
MDSQVTHFVVVDARAPLFAFSSGRYSTGDEVFGEMMDAPTLHLLLTGSLMLESSEDELSLRPAPGT